MSFLDPLRALKALCLFRFTNPLAEIRAAGGRERNPGDGKPLRFTQPTRSSCVATYYAGQSPDEARRMIEEMGFEVERAREGTKGREA